MLTTVRSEIFQAFICYNFDDILMYFDYICQCPTICIIFLFHVIIVLCDLFLDKMYCK